MLNTGELRERTMSLDGTTNLQTLYTFNGRPIPEELRQTGLVREAAIDIHDTDTGWLSWRTGRQLWRVGRSLIYDDYGLGT